MAKIKFDDLIQKSKKGSKISFKDLVPPAEDIPASKEFGFGLAEGAEETSFVGSAINALNVTFPETLKYFTQTRDKKNNALSRKEIKKVKEMSKKERAQYLKALRAQKRKEKAGVTDVDKQVGKGKRITGNILGTLLDPTTLIAPGKTPLTSALKFGALGATDYSLYQKGQSGEIDPLKSLGVGALAGATAGGSQWLGKYFKNKRASRQLVDKVDDVANPQTVPEKQLIDDLETMQRFDPSTLAHEEGTAKIVREFALDEGMDPKDANRLMFGAADHDMGKTKIPKEVLKKPGKYTVAERAEMAKHTEYGKKILKANTGKEGHTEQLFAEYHHKTPMELKEAVKAGKITTKEADEISMIHISDAFEARTAKNRSFYRVPEKADAALAGLIDETNKGLFDETTVKAFAKTISSKNKLRSSRNLVITSDETFGIGKTKKFSFKEKVTTPDYRQVVTNFIGDSATTTKLKQQLLAKHQLKLKEAVDTAIHNRQAALGVTSNEWQMMDDFSAVAEAHLQSKTISPRTFAMAMGQGGGRWDSPDGLVYGTIRSGKTPWQEGLQYTPIGKWGDDLDKPFKFTPERTLWRSGSVVMEDFGQEGKAISKGIIDAESGRRMYSAQKRIEINKIFKGSGINQTSHIKEQVDAALHGLVKDESKLNPKVNKIVKELREVYKSQYKAANDVGLIKKQQLTDYTKAIDKGQIPVVFDEVMLNSKDGRVKLGLLLAKNRNNPTKLEQVVRTFVRNDEEVFDVMHLVQSSPNKDLGEVVDTVLRVRGATLKLDRTRHLSITPALPDEDIAQFLIKDPEFAVKEFSDDLIKQVEYSKVFGANDEIFNHYIDRIGKVSPDAARFVRNQYYTAVGDVGGSDIIQRQINYRLKYKKWSRLNDATNALMTHKMVASALVNSTQVPINGTTLTAQLQGTKNPLYPIKVFMKGLARSATEGGQEFADRSGAVWETTSLDYASQIADAYNTILGKHVAGPFEVLNDPVKFLKVTGNLTVETANRRVAANMGKVILEDLLAQKAKLIGKVKLSSGKLRKLKEIDKHLEWFGVDTTVTPDLVPEEQMLLGVQKFSDAINFRNTTDQVPAWFNNPHLKNLNKFRSFVFKQEKFFLNNVVGPLKKGNPLPAMYYFGAGTSVGYFGAKEFRDFLMGDDREYSNLQDVARGITYINGFGFAADVFLNYDPLAAVAGPAASDLKNIIVGGQRSLNRFGENPEKPFEAISPLAKSIVKTERGMAKVVGRTELLFPQMETYNDWLKGELRDKKFNAYGTKKGKFGIGSNNGKYGLKEK